MKPLRLIDAERLGYGAVVVLEDVTFTVRQGERVVLLGRSGVGKTTLLTSLYGRLIEAQLPVALVPQDHALVPQFSVFHNVYMGRLDRRSALFNLANLVWPMARELAKVRLELEAVALDGLERRTVDGLSGGQKQRVAVARALYRGGDFLLADEPVSAVDQTQAVALLKVVERRFATTILALHDVDVAFQHASRLIGLRSGRVAFDRPASAVSRSEIDDLYHP